MKQTSTNTPQNKCGKRNGLFLRLASLLLVFLTSAGAWAQKTYEITTTFDENSNGSISKDGKTYKAVEDNITLQLKSDNGKLQIAERYIGINDPDGKGSLTFTSKAGNIKSITIEHEEFTVGENLKVTADNGTYTAPDANGTATWTDINSTSCKLSFKGDNADIKATKFIVVYEATEKQLPVKEPKLPASTVTTENPFTVTITNQSSGATVYYTLDGSDPTPTQTDEEGVRGHFTELTYDLNLTKDALVRAMAAINYEGYDVVESEIVEAKFTILDGNNFVINKSDLNRFKAGTSVKRDNITMTFGGVPGEGTYTEFRKTSTANDVLGLGGVLTAGYAVCDNGLDCLSEGFRDATTDEKASDAKKNNKWRILHKESLTPSQLPAYGSYYKFEPRVNGTLTISVEQQGLLNQTSSQGDPDFTQVRLRPVYFIDENGVSQEAASAKTTSLVNWKINSIDRDKIKKDDQHYTKEQMQTLYDMYYAYFNDKGMSSDDAKTANPILVLHSNGKGVRIAGADGQTTQEDYTTLSTFWPALQKVQKEVYPDDYYNDGTGYFIPTEGFVAYTFNVEAGKTYYLYGVRTKLAICGFDFDPTSADEETSAEAVTLENASTNADKLASLDQTKHYDVTVNRTFKKGEWTSLVLPFNVSTQALHSALGAEDATTSGDIVEASAIKDVDVLNFTSIELPYLNVTKHFNQMIIAGTPVFVRPNRDVTDPVFKNVIITKTAVDPVTDANGYTLTGSYDLGTAPQYSYVLRNGKAFEQYTGTKGYAMDAMSAWITGANASLKLTMNVIGGNGEGGTTGIFSVADYSGAKVSNDAVYNLNGQKLGKALPKGVYIKGGKKYIVK